MENIKINTCTISDCKDIWLWRNNQIVRINSFNDKKIEWSDHQNWFKKSLNDPKSILLIATNTQNKKLGLVRFNENNKYQSEVSINLNPDYIGKKLSKSVLSKAISFYKKKKFAILIAKVKHSNFASIKCFESCDFSLQEKKNDYLIYKNKNLIIDQIEKIRLENNENWINLIDVAMKSSEIKTKKILEKINSCDQKVSKFLDILIK